MAHFPSVPGSHAPDWSSDLPTPGPVGVDTVVTDQHAFIHRARVRVVTPRSVAEVVAAVNQARATGTSLAVSGGRHAMGGQAWADRRVMLDMRQLDRVRWVDVQAGLVCAEAGVQWPALLAEIDRLQAEAGAAGRWSIAQKQTGADDLTLGGAVAANIHGRGLSMTPLVGDIHALTVVTPDGVVRQIDRQHEPDLFALVIGGYGLFGVVVEVVLRLVPRQTLRRIVRVIDIHDAIGAAERRISEGCIYGDFQFDIDPRSPDFLTKGVMACYAPVPEIMPQTLAPPARSLRREDWLQLLHLAHVDKPRAFAEYAAHYIRTDGQLYTTDSHQYGTYVRGYHAELDQHLHATCPGSEMITELYVPPHRLMDFLRDAARQLSGHGSIGHAAQVIYGTIRLTRSDTETFLPWAHPTLTDGSGPAPDRWACVIFNLHIDHTTEGLTRAAEHFRGLINLATARGGSYYLTYHRFATAAQLRTAHPRMDEFMAEKARRDPHGVLTSDWYEHTRQVLAGSSASTGRDGEP